MESPVTDNLPQKLSQSSPTNRAEKSTAVAEIAALITYVVANINVQFNMNPEQIVTCAIKIYESKENMDVSQIKRCFDAGMTGQYGPLFNRMDMTVLFGWLAAFEKNEEIKANGYDKLPGFRADLHNNPAFRFKLSPNGTAITYDRI